MKKIFWLVALCISIFKMNAQMCIEIRAESYSIMQNQNFKAEIILQNIPQNALVKMDLNQVALKVKDGRTQLIIPAYIVGENTSILLISVYLKDKLIMSESRTIQFSCFPPRAQFDGPNDLYLFSEIWNPVNIFSPGINTEDMIITPIGCGLRKLDKGKFEIKADSGVKKVSLQVTVKTGERLINLGTKYFMVRDIPNPSIVLKFYNDSNGIKLMKPYFFAEMPVALSSFKWVVKSWKLSVYHNKMWTYFNGAGNGFSLEIMKLLNHMNAGDKLMLENVECTTGSGSNMITTMGSFALTWE